MELTVALKDKSYSIYIESFILEHVKDYLEEMGKVLILSDDRVPFVYIETLLKQIPYAETFIFPHGENNKTLETYQSVVDKLLKLNFSRNDYLITLGGGVVGDLGGFVASTFKRGMKWINIPTTTLSMVDSSIGGKVAINYAEIKNVIGSFYHPEVVLIDTNVLQTLPKRHFINGIIEALKVGIIGDYELYKMLFNDNYRQNIDEIIYRSLKFKANIVMKDEKEYNIRKILNFGHTFGHAYESYFAMKNYLHGEAVALGMLTVSKGKYYYKELKTLLEKWKVKTEVTVEKEKIIKLIKNDKKVHEKEIDLIEVPNIGECKIIRTPIDRLYQYLEVEK